MARILIAALPWIKEGAKEYFREGMRWSYTSTKSSIVSFRAFPFYMAYTASILEKEGHTVKVIDSLAEVLSNEDFLKKAADSNPNFIISETSTPSFNNDIERIKELKRETKAKIIVGGQHASALPEFVAKRDFIDHVIVGEYEFASRDIINGKKTDKIVKAEIKQLDEFPWPARHKFNMKLYNETFCKYPNTQIISSRGCPYSCNYCNVFQMAGGRFTRYRNPYDVLEEMNFCIDKYHPKEFWMEDDNINSSPKKLKNFCMAKIKEKNEFPFKAMGHCNISKDSLDLLKMAGCTGMKLGVESTDETVLKRLGKGITVPMILKTLKNCRDLGIKTHLTYAIGLPGDTEESIKKTLDFAKKYGDAYQISLATPFPGTPLFEEAKENGWLKYDNWNHFDGMNECIINYPDLPAEKIFELYREGQEATYKKVLHSGDFIKYAKMIYYERGIKGLWFALRKRRDILKSMIKRD